MGGWAGAKGEVGCCAAVFAGALIFAASTIGAQEATSLYGEHGVSPQAVRQSGLRGAYFHATMASLAHAAPDHLKSEIIWNPRGWYEVHFSSGQDEEVFPDDVMYDKTHGLDSSEGIWVLVLENAYAHREVREALTAGIQESASIPSYAKPFAVQSLNFSGRLLEAYERAIRFVVGPDGKVDRDAFKAALASQFNAMGVPAAQAGMLVGYLDDSKIFERLANTVRRDGEIFGAGRAPGMGGLPVRVMETFLGAAHQVLFSDQKSTLDSLRRLHRGGVAMVAGTWGSAPDGLAKSSWWVDAHAYSVLDYDETTKTVSLRNPWGKHPEPDGYFTVPLSVFLQGFESCTLSD
jgi:hypothetical protein